MSRHLFALILGSVVFLAGCVPVFLNPAYTTEDVFFEPALVGDWNQENQEADGVWQFRAGTDGTYVFTHRESDGKEPRPYEVHLFRLGEDRFLDFYPLEKDGTKVSDALLIPAHFLYQVHIETGRVVLRGLNWKWMEEQMEEKKFSLPYVKANDVYLVTSPTDEIQTFLREQILPHEEAFQEAEILLRQEKALEGKPHEANVSSGH